MDPPDGARLDQAPDTATLTFSEQVSADLGGVRVLDSDGERVDEGAVRVDGAVVTGGVALAARGAGVVLAMASVAALSGWALYRVQALVRPVLPTDLPFAVDRATIALAMGTSLAVAYQAVTSGALTLPALEDDDAA